MLNLIYIIVANENLLSEKEANNASCILAMQERQLVYYVNVVLFCAINYQNSSSSVKNTVSQNTNC